MMQQLSVLLMVLMSALAFTVLPGCGDDDTTVTETGTLGTPPRDLNCADSCPVGKNKVDDTTVPCGFRCETPILDEDNDGEPFCAECPDGQRVVARDDNPCGYICQLPSQEQEDIDIAGGGDGAVCAGACGAGRATICTCRADDPCGWADNGSCDTRCVGVLDEIFNDNADCCDGACFTGEANACTCAPEDVCGFQTDSACQQVSLLCAEFDGGLTTEDPINCCEGACGSGQYNACSCAPDDPCNWQGDAYCDSNCANVLDEPFDDSADCQ